MMSIVDALRRRCGHDSRSVEGCLDCEAADEIERLRKAASSHPQPVQTDPAKTAAQAVPHSLSALSDKEVLAIAPMAGNYSADEGVAFCAGFRRCAMHLAASPDASTPQHVECAACVTPLVCRRDGGCRLLAGRGVWLAVEHEFASPPQATQQAEAAPAQPEPVPWPTFESASADPLFHECRAIMGTADVGQDIALQHAINNFVARQSIKALRATAPAQPSADQVRAALRDPAQVHVAMLRGEIAKPDIRSMLHVYGEAALARWDASAQPSATAGEAQDAARFAWWFSEAPKPDAFMATYLQGVREHWSLDQWRTAIDAALAQRTGGES
jgi:hypothetical protein